MTTATRRPLSDAEQSAIHLAGELEQLLRTLHPDHVPDQEAVRDARVPLRLGHAGRGRG